VHLRMLTEPTFWNNRKKKQ